YLDAGINIGIGADVMPQNLMAEMRTAALMAKVGDESFLSGDAHDVFDAATLGGAKALRDDSIGRLVEGAAADVTVFSLSGLHNTPVLDPIRSLIHTAEASDVTY